MSDLGDAGKIRRQTFVLRASLAATVVCAVVLPLGAYAAPIFAPPLSAFATTAWVPGLAVGDVNGDANPDVIAASDTANVVAVLMGSGDGSFSGPVFFATGDRANAVSVADFDHDGAVDLVVGLKTGIGILRGRGDGSFDPIIVRALLGGAQQVYTCDLNGDATPDVVGMSASQSFVRVMLGNGDGTFAPTITRSDFIGPNGLAFGDLDGDGLIDMVESVGDCDGEIYRLLGHGDGTFGAPLQFGAHLCNPFSPAVGDVDGDGKADVVVSELSFSTLAVYSGGGDGTFGAKASYPLGGACFAIVLRDLDVDGKLDVASASVSPGIVSTLLEGAGGGLSGKQDCTVGGSLRAIASADFDRNGLPDLVVGGTNSNLVTILLNRGDPPPLGVPELPSAGGVSNLRVSPNPLRTSARATFTLSARTVVQLSVFDLAGRLVARGVFGPLPAGTHDAPLALNADKLRPGIYLVELRAGATRECASVCVVN